MANSKTNLIFSISAMTVSLLVGIVGNVAASTLPENWEPYLWFAWPIFGVFLLLSIAILIWQSLVNKEQVKKASIQPIESQKADAINNALGETITIFQQENKPMKHSSRIPRTFQPTLEKNATESPDSLGKERFKNNEVFISYSHQDEDWKDRLVTHLKVLQMQDMINVWDDRRIEVGDGWRPEIEKAINRASFAILMISANFLTSKFILDTEVPKLLERRSKSGLRVIPLIVKPCAWKQVDWLSEIQGRPKDNQPLSSGSEYQIDANLAALANEIAAIVKS